jgi:hypothetical protein
MIAVRTYFQHWTFREEGCHVSRGWVAAGQRRDGSERAGEQGGEEGPDKEPRKPNTVT